MVFCGQCGYQLAPGDTVCPRCGTPVELDLDLTLDNPEPDNPTVASGLINAPTQQQPHVQPPASPGAPLTPAQQQPLILGPRADAYDANAQMANETTSSLGAQPYDAPNQAAPFNPHTNTPLHGYVPQSASNYPQQGISYPGYAPPGGMGYQPPADPYATRRAEIAAQNRTGRIVGLLFILLGLLLILGAMVIYVIERNASPSALVPLWQAQAMFNLYHLI